MKEHVIKAIDAVSPESSQPTTNTVDSLAKNASALRNEKRLRTLYERSEVRLIERLESGALRSYDPLAQFDVAARALDLPKLSKDSWLTQMRDAFRDFVSDNPGVSYQRLSLTGRRPITLLSQAVDYVRLHDTVRIPLGNLQHLTLTERERLMAITRQIANRVASMSSLPFDDYDALASALLSTTGSDGAAVAKLAEDLGHDLTEDTFRSLDQTERVRRLADILLDAQTYAQKRFIGMSLLQPLYRDVLVNRSDFRAPSADAIIDMAVRHSVWEREVSLGTLHSVIEIEVDRHMGANPFIGGLGRLREATFGGVEQNVCYAFADMSEALRFDDQARGDLAWYQAQELEGGGVLLGTIVGNVKRTPVIKDVLGQPVTVSDRFDAVTSYDVPVAALREQVIFAASLLGDLKGMKVARRIDLTFLSRFPEWTGFVTKADEVPLDVLISSLDWLRHRVFHDYMVALLNSTFVSSSVKTAFVKPNMSDAAKAYEEGLYYYALAQKVLGNVLTQFLTVARASLELYKDPIWDELDALGLGIPTDVRTGLQEAYVAKLTSSLPVVTPQEGRLQAARYYMDDEALAVVPGVARLLQNLSDLGVVGSIKTEGHFTFPFRTSSSAPVDAMSFLSDLPDNLQWLRRELAATVDMVDARQLNRLVQVTGLPARARLFEADVTPGGFVVEGSFLSVAVPKQIIVSFNKVSRLQTIPIEERWEDAAIDENDVSLLHGRGRSLLVPISVTPFFSVDSRFVTITDGTFDIFVPRTAEEVQQHLARWSHQVKLDLSSDPTSGVVSTPTV